jgi:hypothetical protein
MLIVSLVFTAALLAIAYRLARSSARYAAAGTLCGLSFFAGLPIIMLPAHSLASFLCLAAAIVCAVLNAPPRRFLQSSLALAVVSYGFVTVTALWHVHDQNRLRAEFPLESIAARLSYENRLAPMAVRNASARVTDTRTSPKPTAQYESMAAGQATNNDLSALEELVDLSSYRTPNGLSNMREVSLRRLHEDSVGDFINSPGFGVSRRIEPRREYIVLPDAEPVPQLPAEYVPPENSLANSEIDGPNTVNAVITDKALHSHLQNLHQNGFADFVNAPGFGYVKDREHVAGFQPHQFHAMPSYESKDKEPVRWRVQRLELLSLLKFDEPAVYVSEHLPRMDELRDAKTRPLDEFERRGLAGLRRGKDLELEYTTNRIRMLGSIRSLEQCIKCHEVNRGELLGAFSYVLKRVQESDATLASPTAHK